MIDEQEIPGADSSFYALALAIERASPDSPSIGSTDGAAREAVAFRANASFAFPPSDLHSVKRGPDGRFEVLVNFLNMAGATSPLPPYYTELAVMDAREGGVIVPFLDVFHHRLVSLLYQIWRHNRLEVRIDAPGGDSISRRLGALIGLPPDLDDDALPLPRGRLLPYLGAIAMYTASADMVGKVIAAVVQASCRIDEFILRMVEIPPEYRASLGTTCVTLGGDFVIGERTPDRAGKFRIALGPLDRGSFRRFLPGADGIETIRALISLMVNAPLTWDYQLTLEAGAAPNWSLGHEPLGWSTWLAPDPRHPIVVIV